MKKIAFILPLLQLACMSITSHHANNLDNPSDNSSFNCPMQVDSLHLCDLFDSAKWYLYVRNCDKYYKPINDSSVSVPFGCLELRFSTIYMTHDTVILSFSFMDKDKAILSGMTRDLAQFPAGVGFSMTTKKRLFVTGPGFYYSERGNNSASRYLNPLQPAVLEFIKKNSSELNPWFMAQARRRKII